MGRLPVRLIKIFITVIIVLLVPMFRLMTLTMKYSTGQTSSETENMRHQNDVLAAVTTEQKWVAMDYKRVVYAHFGHISEAKTGNLNLYERTVKQYQDLIEIFCKESELPGAKIEVPLCACVWPQLHGYNKPRWKIQMTMESLQNFHPEVTSGGSWAPHGCTPRYKLAIVVPFMKRQEQLIPFLNHMHPFLQRQGLAYTIFLVEQMKPAVFNKASLMNVGVLELEKLDRYDCIIFHDVDMLPEDDRLLYMCGPRPVHLGFLVEKFKYRLIYQYLFGGVTAFTPRQLAAINGFPNSFWGWGGEDDEIHRRVRQVFQGAIRFPREVSKYTMMKHKKDAPRVYENLLYLNNPKPYEEDGLSNVNYTVLGIENRHLYTWIKVSLPKPPNNLTDRYTRAKIKV